MLLSEGQMSDYKGAALMIESLPRAKTLLADRGYDADWFRAALTERGITACIPSKTNRKTPTYVSTWSGFVYVAFVIDAYARRIVGWRVSRTKWACSDGCVKATLH